MNIVNAFTQICVVMGLAIVSLSCQEPSANASRAIESSHRNLELLHAAYMNDIFRRSALVSHERVVSKNSGSTVNATSTKSALPEEKPTQPEQKKKTWAKSARLVL